LLGNIKIEITDYGDVITYINGRKCDDCELLELINRLNEANHLYRKVGDTFVKKLKEWEDKMTTLEESK